MSSSAHLEPSEASDLDSLTLHVQELVAELLDTSAQKIGLEIPLVALGLESFVAVRLRRRLHEDFGCNVQLSDFLGDATVTSVAERIAEPGAVRANTAPPATHAAPAAPLDLPTDGSYGGPDQTFELTPIQAAYLAGREPVFPLGGVATFYYTEFDRVPVGDPSADIERLNATFNELVRRHGMLRAVMVGGQQRILGSVPPYRIDVLDLRGRDVGEVEDRLEAVRQARSHQLRPADRWPLFDLYAVLLPDGRTRLCCGFDVLVLDLKGFMQLLQEWGRLFVGDTDLPLLPRTFADLVLARAEDPELDRRRRLDESYWRSRELPDGPALPWTRSMAEIRGHRFARHTERLDAASWATLQERARSYGLTATGLLLAAFGFTLQRWGADRDFCLNTTLFDREDLAFGSAEEGTAHVIGDFTTTALVAVNRVDLRTFSGFARYASAINRTFWEAMEHRTVAGVSVRDVADRPLDPATGLPLPTHPVVFTSGLGLADESYSRWLGTEVYGVSQTPQVLLDHIVRTADGELVIDWDHVQQVLPPGILTGLAAAHMRLLRRLAEDADAWTDPTLGFIPSFEPNPPKVEGAFGACGPLLDDPWLSVAAERPTAVALTGAGVSHSYGALDRLTARNAEVLTDRGVSVGDLVGVRADKGVAQVTAALSVLRAGCGYVPIEPAWPDERVVAVLEQAGIRHVLEAGCESVSGSRSGDAGWRQAVTIHAVDRTGALHADPSEGAAPVRGSADDLAYVIFTSGSTGRPKGVAIEHRAARTTLDDLDVRFPLGEDDCLLALAAFSFDLSVYDVFSLLGSGGRLVMPDVAGQRDPGHWLDLMAEHRVTAWNTAPALLEMLVEYGEIDPEATRGALSHLRLVFLSADWIPVSLPDRLRRFAPQAQVISLGGATEASIWSIGFPIGEVDPAWQSIPYGRALRGQSFHILDSEGRPCPVGTDGELYIGGAGLARGYVGNPAETLHRFIQNPVLGRLYRTGDLGRWRSDGTIQFLGRVDRQVKIRGHRIELGEIDATLSQVPGVRQVFARAVQGPDDRPRLVAYVCAAAGHHLDDDTLIDALQRRLPSYMVPNHFVWLTQLPLTDNGKVDYRALPNPYDAPSKSEPPSVNDEAPAQAQAACAGESAPERRALSSLPPVSQSPQEAQAVAGVAEAFTAAAETGLALRLIVDRGALDPVAALSQAGSWTEQLRARLQAAGLPVTTRVPEQGLVELSLLAGAAPVAYVAPTAETVADLTRTQVVKADGAAEPRDSDSDATDPQVVRAVARVFSELLGRPVDVDTPYFRLGATSLNVVNAHRQLRESLDPELTVVEMFASPTVRGTAAVISRRKHGAAFSQVEPTPGSRAEPMPGPASEAPVAQPGNPRRAGRLAARQRASRVSP